MIEQPVAWTTMPDADDWAFVSGPEDPNGRLPGVWFPMFSKPQIPNDMAIVPISPTESMIKAAAKYHEGELYLPYSLYKIMVETSQKDTNS